MCDSLSKNSSKGRRYSGREQEDLSPCLVIKKRYFQLLEVMIATLLITLCAMPILNAYIRMSQSQIENGRIWQRDHLAHLAYAKIIENFYKQHFKLQDVLDKKEGSFDELPNANDEDQVASQLKKLSYKCSYQLSKKKPKDDVKDKLLIQIILTIQDISKKPERAESIQYDYVVFAKKK